MGREESVALGRAARRQVPLEAHSELPLSADRDPIGLLIEQNADRVLELVPVRFGRMLVSPFTFFRGAALPMAADLAGTPTTNLRAQLCGDAHLSNFGAYASPERRLMFDVNDFDETLPGPFEWDVKRLVASMAIAGRDNNLGARERRAVALATVAAYRTAMREFATMPILAVWYARFDVEDAVGTLQGQIPDRIVQKTMKRADRARTRDGLQALGRFTQVVNGAREFVSDPPLTVPIEDLASGRDPAVLYRFMHSLVDDYARTLSREMRYLVRRFTLTRMARRVVGVGSVGTQCWILLMEPDDGTEPLILQSKQANQSVLARYAGNSEYENQGERVVAGQRLMQAATDIFLGWKRATIPGSDEMHDYYLRQMRDWKFSVPIERLEAASMRYYGRLCGWTLARAHARSGDRIAIAAYLGKSDKFDQAVAEFGEAYADVSEKDHAALEAAAHTGRVTATAGV